MPLLEIIGTAVIGGALVAFNPLSALIQNPLIVGLVTIIIGVGLYMFAGKAKGLSKIVHLVAAGFIVAGIVPLVASIAQMAGGRVAQQVSL